MVFSASELLPFHILSTCCCLKCMYVFLLLSNHLSKFHLSPYVHCILSGWVIALVCIKYMLKVYTFLLLSNLSPNSTCCLMPMVFSGGKFVAFSWIRCMLLLKVNVLFLLLSNLLPIFHLPFYAQCHGILSWWVVAFPYIVCSCWKCMYFFIFSICHLNSTCRLMQMVYISGSELLPSLVLSTCSC